MSALSILPSPATRLIVLVPTASIDEMRLARRIWTLALKAGCDVLYVALVRDADEESRARRSLALLTSITRDDRLHVASQVIFQAQWPKALRPLVQPGDVIVCLAEQTVKRFGRSDVLLGNYLSVEFNGRVHVLDDISTESPPARRAIWPTIRSAMPFAIVASFLEFQMWATTQLARGATSNAVLAFSVVVEFSLIWLWISRVN